MQAKAVAEVAGVLNRGGHYVMVENLTEGHVGMNNLRRKLKLKSIPVRWHNNYLDEKFIENVVGKRFSVVRRENISSVYYLITRVIYSKLCQLEGREPDYENVIYRLAAELDECAGNYGPICLYLLRKI
jgi:hypothetical protein